MGRVDAGGRGRGPLPSSAGEVAVVGVKVGAVWVIVVAVDGGGTRVGRVRGPCRSADSVLRRGRRRAGRGHARGGRGESLLPAETVGAGVVRAALEGGGRPACGWDTVSLGGASRGVGAGG